MFIFILSLLSVFGSSSAHASEMFASDPRTQGVYTLFFDIGSTSRADIANGYGGYLQYYFSGGKEVFRFCDNFEGSGLSGRPNLSKKRELFVPINTVNPNAYLCHDISLRELNAGRKIIYIGEKSFFALSSPDWKTNVGGTLLFQIAKKVPLIGSPKYKNIRLRATRTGAKWVIEMIVPKGETLTASWLQFVATVSGLGVPNGISNFTLNPGTRTERAFDIDTLEDVK